MKSKVVLAVIVFLGLLTFAGGAWLYVRYQERGSFNALREKAKAGNPRAQFELGLRHASGLGTKKNLVRAIFWYRKAARSNVPEAQFILGIYYSYGEGIPKNAAKAAYWLLKAAANGNVEAQWLTARNFQIGIGVPEDQPKAACWLKQGANQGDGRAMLELYYRYKNGNGVKFDYAKSYMWLLLASRSKQYKDNFLTQSELTGFRTMAKIKYYPPGTVERGEKMATNWRLKKEARQSSVASCAT